MGQEVLGEEPLEMPAVHGVKVRAYFSGASEFKDDGITEEWVHNVVELCLRRNGVPEQGRRVIDYFQNANFEVRVNGLKTDNGRFSAVNVDASLVQRCLLFTDGAFKFRFCQVWVVGGGLLTQEASKTEQRLRESLEQVTAKFCVSYREMARRKGIPEAESRAGAEEFLGSVILFYKKAADSAASAVKWDGAELGRQILAATSQPASIEVTNPKKEPFSEWQAETARKSTPVSEPDHKIIKNRPDSARPAKVQTLSVDEHSIQEIVGRGKFIRLDDGSLWSVDSSDMSTTETWTSGSEVVLIARSVKGFILHHLVNAEDDPDEEISVTRVD